MLKCVSKDRFRSLLGPGECPEMQFSIQTCFFAFRISHYVEKLGDDGSDRSPTFKKCGDTTVFDAGVLIWRFEARCVAKSAMTLEAIGVSRLFFRGRRQWPQASQSADPGGHEACGAHCEYVL